MKILYADSIDESGVNALRRAGHQCVVEPGLTAETLPEAIPGCDVVVVRSTKVTAETIAAADQLGLIVRAGAGTDNVDKAAASGKGIFVCNVPGRNAIAVAELTIGLLLAVDRRIADNTADLRNGTWNKSVYTKADGLHGKRIGIIGLGDIGLAVAERAKGFGLTVTAVRKQNRSAKVQAAIRSIGIRMVDDLDTLLAESDIISIHVPKDSTTTAMINAEFLAKLKPGTILLNTSRGDVIDEDALIAALDNGGIRAGLDVWMNEPGSGTGAFQSRLASHPAVVGTHHIGASTAQAQRSVADGITEVIEAYIAGAPINCVNLRLPAEGHVCMTVRHLDRIGVLAKVFAVLRTNGLNVQQVQNQIFSGGEAAVASITVSAPPTDDVIRSIQDIDEVMNVVVTGQDG